MRGEQRRINSDGISWQRLFLLIASLVLVLCFGFSSEAKAGGSYTDTSFQGDYTTSNLDAIISAYNLNDGWYWTSQAGIKQTYKANKDKPGWTWSTNNKGRTSWVSGWYGCRWDWDTIDAKTPNKYGSGECYGFAEFIGYLLSGKRAPQGGQWKKYTSLSDAGGLRVGDIIRIENSKGAHSAVVYSVNGDTVKFIQCGGSNYNKLNMKTGFWGVGLNGSTSAKTVTSVSGLKIWRSHQNLGAVTQKEIEITEAVYPSGSYGTLTNFGLRGIIATSGYLKSVEGRLFNLATKQDDQAKKVTFSNTATNTYDLKGAINDALKFGGMTGYYEYEVVVEYVVDGTEKKATLIDSFFTIGDYKLLTSLSLDRSEITFAPGDSVRIYASYTPSDASNASLSWESSDTRVVTVSSDGIVNALNPGTATIRCSAADGSGLMTVCDIEVLQPVKSILLSGSNEPIPPGSSTKIEASVWPQDATNQTLFWTTEDSSIATVSQDGTVFAVSPGTVTITAIAEDASGVSNSIVILVEEDNKQTGAYGDNIFWELRDGLLRVYGNGDMPERSEGEEIPWREHIKEVENIIVEEGISSLCDSAFSTASNLITVQLPNSLQRIGQNAFYACEKLENINLPESLEIIKTHAFWYCTSLRNITIPANVREIGIAAFGSCGSLYSFTVAENNQSYCTQDGLLYNKDKTQLIMYTAGKQGILNIPDGVEIIGEHAVRFCPITSVVFPETLKEIRARAFEYCTEITAISLPKSISVIGECAFSDCYKLTGAAFLSRNVKIGNGIFENHNSPELYNRGLTLYCYRESTAVLYAEENNIYYRIMDPVAQIGDVFSADGLKYKVTSENEAVCIGRDEEGKDDTLLIPNTVEYMDIMNVTGIAEYAFYEDTLASVTIGNNVKTIGKYSFAHCANLKTVKGGAGVTSIGIYVFSADTSLTSVPTMKNVSSIGTGAFQNCKKLTSFTISSKLSSISNKVFYNCISLRTLKGGASVKNIGDNAFRGDKAMTSFPEMERLQTIGAYAFRECRKLSKFMLGANVKSIGKYAFYNCSGLKKITVLTTKLTSSNVKTGAFKGIYKKAVFSVPKKKIKSYKIVFENKGAPSGCTYIKNE